MDAAWVIAACSIVGVVSGLVYHIRSDARTLDEFRRFKRRVKRWMREQDRTVNRRRD